MIIEFVPNVKLLNILNHHKIEQNYAPNTRLYNNAMWIVTPCLWIVTHEKRTCLLQPRNKKLIIIPVFSQTKYKSLQTYTNLNIFSQFHIFCFNYQIRFHFTCISLNMKVSISLAVSKKKHKMIKHLIGPTIYKCRRGLCRKPLNNFGTFAPTKV